MTRRDPFEAVIADMDGVLTRTAALHERAWKRVFDDYLRSRGDPKPFSSADYRVHVDGKPRYDGVADFLASRGIEIPRGRPSDDPDQETVCGIGNRKNELFLELLDHDGALVFGDAVAAVDRWQRGGLLLAVVSASKNCRRILRAADLERRVDAIVDGRTAEELRLPGKAGIMREAARQLAVVPGDAVVLEDATAGVRAARAERFGLVVGIARGGDRRDLHEAGADQVVPSVFRARFPRRLPDALRHREELAAWRGDRDLAVFLDFDGTLAEIVHDPREAWMTDEMRAAVEALAARCPLAIVSGRDREDVQARVAIDEILYAGDHGFDIAGRGHAKTLPEAEDAVGDVARAERALRDSVGHIPGVIIERKRFSVAVHYRKVDAPSDVDRVRRAAAAAREATGLRRQAGKKVIELMPAIEWDKGRAVRWLMDVTGVEPQRSFAVYVGDDETDEDAFAALEGDGAGIRVGGEVAASLADYRLAGQGGVRELLLELARTL